MMFFYMYKTENYRKYVVLDKNTIFILYILTFFFNKIPCSVGTGNLMSKKDKQPYRSQII